MITPTLPVQEKRIKTKEKNLEEFKTRKIIIRPDSGNELVKLEGRWGKILFWISTGRWYYPATKENGVGIESLMSKISF